MKNLILIVTTFLLSSIAFAQTESRIIVCNKQLAEVRIKDLVECKKLLVNDSEYKVNSFIIGFKINEGKDYIEIKHTDNMISDKTISEMVKHNPTMVYIEKIEFVNKNGEIVVPKETCAKISK